MRYCISAKEQSAIEYIWFLVRCISVSGASTACHIIYMNRMRDKENVHLHYASGLDFFINNLENSSIQCRLNWPFPAFPEQDCIASSVFHANMLQAYSPILHSSILYHCMLKRKNGDYSTCPGRPHGMIEGQLKKDDPTPLPAMGNGTGLPTADRTTCSPWIMSLPLAFNSSPAMTQTPATLSPFSLATALSLWL
ncbi:hypothetical protein Pcinc_041262 [Petrolisthes cinctipes]|uniref:Uncharacterized protein n=1 Tax=Petrolisthes cinctipes TaxID=88211 RepID=A0AAE1BK75_PETCI|nr:hypothetical protein Pcinc_041262 [Petrolisthes cinctipes]